MVFNATFQGRIQGGAHPAHAPSPPKIRKNMIFWRKIVIFHTKYPKTLVVTGTRCIGSDIMLNRG
jgi:hypothetical protein